MQFNYRARSAKGEIFQGVVEAASEDEAANLLSEKNLTVIVLAAIQKQSTSRASLNVGFGKTIKTKDLVIFSRQLAVMTSANLPIMHSLRIISQQTDNKKLRQISIAVADEVESGVKLSSALGRYPKVFNSFFVSVIKSGETSGRLDEVLDYLANQIEKDYDVASKIKGAMIYPCIIVIGLVIVAVAMLIFVIPQMTTMLLDANVPLPFATKLLINTSNLFRNYWYLLLIGLVLIVIAGRWYINTPAGRKEWDNSKIRMPIFGSLFKKIYLVRFTHSMSTLISSGIPLVSSLKLVEEVVGNRAYKDLIEDTIKEVQDGNSIGTVMVNSKIVPKMVSNMLIIGEKTGKSGEILKQLSNFYTREIENAVNNLAHIIEPVIMVVIGVAVGFMVSAIIMPMYQLAGSM